MPALFFILIGLVVVVWKVAHKIQRENDAYQRRLERPRAVTPPDIVQEQLRDLTEKEGRG